MPNGETIGYALGDESPPKPAYHVASHRISASGTGFNSSVTSKNDIVMDIPQYNNSHPWGVFFTILGTVLLDFDADACQSPARAYLLDVTVPGEFEVLLNIIVETTITSIK